LRFRIGAIRNNLISTTESCRSRSILTLDWSVEALARGPEPAYAGVEIIKPITLVSIILN